MQKLYLMRHGQTTFNTEHLLQGRCDSPLTELGIEQARRASAWLRAEGIAPCRVAVSPLGRTKQTLAVVREEIPALGDVPTSEEPGLQERDFGSYEGQPFLKLPWNPWYPGEAAVPRGGETTAAARYRIVNTLHDLMEGSEGDVLAFSHGSIIRTFKTYWADFARCEQDIRLRNCCILVFEYDRATQTFANTQIVNMPEEE